MNNYICELGSKHCKPCGGDTFQLERSVAERYLEELPGWVYVENAITKNFEFKNYYQTMSFVNAVAWIAHKEGHHPDMKISYCSCIIQYSTHAIGGLSENDFICAAKVEALFGV